MPEERPSVPSIVRTRAASFEGSPQVRTFREAIRNSLVATKLEPVEIEGLMNKEFHQSHSIEELHANKDGFIKAYLGQNSAKVFIGEYNKEAERLKIITPVIKKDPARQGKYDRDHFVEELKEEFKHRASPRTVSPQRAVLSGKNKKESGRGIH